MVKKKLLKILELFIRGKKIKTVTDITDEMINEGYAQVKILANKDLENAMEDKPINYINAYKEFLEIVEEAYKQLATEESRDIYRPEIEEYFSLSTPIETLLDNLKNPEERSKINMQNKDKDVDLKWDGDANLAPLQKLIIHSNGNVYERIEVQNIGIGNRAADVKGPAIDKKGSDPDVEEVVYSDGRAVICSYEPINFHNGLGVKNSIGKYRLIIKLAKDKVESYDFYARLFSEEMENEEYRIAVYQAIKGALDKGEIYIGEITFLDGKFISSQDGAERDAVIQYNKMNEMREAAPLKGVNR